MLSARTLFISVLLFVATVSVQATTIPGVLAIGPMGEQWQAIVAKNTPVLFESETNSSGYAEAMGIYMDQGIVVRIYVHAGSDTLNSAQVRDYFYNELYADNKDYSDFNKTAEGRRGRMTFWAYKLKGVTVNQYFETVSMSRGSWRIHFEISKANMHSDAKNTISAIVGSCGLQDTPKGVAVIQDIALEGLEFWTSKVDGAYRMYVSKDGGEPNISIRDNETNKVLVETTNYTTSLPGAGALSDKLNTRESIDHAESKMLGSTEFAWAKIGSSYKVIASNGSHDMYLNVYAANDDVFMSLLQSLAGN